MSLRDLAHKYTRVRLPSDDRHLGLKDPQSLMFQEILSAAEKVAAIELDLRRVVRYRDELNQKITKQIAAGPNDEILPINGVEAVDKLPQLIVAWRLSISYLQRCVALYKRFEQEQVKV